MQRWVTRATPRGGAAPLRPHPGRHPKRRARSAKCSPLCSLLTPLRLRSRTRSLPFTMDPQHGQQNVAPREGAARLRPAIASPACPMQHLRRCGSAGTYSILQTELSHTRNRVQALESDRPDVIATANIGVSGSYPDRHCAAGADGFELLRRSPGPSRVTAQNRTTGMRPALGAVHAQVAHVAVGGTVGPAGYHLPAWWFGIFLRLRYSAARTRQVHLRRHWQIPSWCSRKILHPWFAAGRDRSVVRLPVHGSCADGVPPAAASHRAESMRHLATCAAHLPRGWIISAQLDPVHERIVHGVQVRREIDALARKVSRAHVARCVAYFLLDAMLRQQEHGRHSSGRLVVGQRFDLCQQQANQGCQIFRGHQLGICQCLRRCACRARAAEYQSRKKMPNHHAGR